MTAGATTLAETWTQAQADAPIDPRATLTRNGEDDHDDDGSAHPDADGEREQAELEAGMRESLAAAGVKPKRGGRVAKGVH